MLLRVAAVAGLGYYAYHSFQQDSGIGDLKYYIIFGGLAILYNPFLPVELTRALWTPINLGTALVLIMYGLIGDGVSKEEPEKVFTEHTPTFSEVARPKMSSASVNSTIQKVSKEDKFQTALSLIVDPLLMQRDTFIINEKGGEAYLKSHSAIGFVGGFTDGFLQTVASRMSLNDQDETMLMAAVHCIIFENMNANTNQFFELQLQNDGSFMQAQMVGGSCAFKLLKDPQNKEAQMGWYLHFEDWCDQKLNS